MKLFDLFIWKKVAHQTWVAKDKIVLRKACLCVIDHETNARKKLLA